MMVHNDESIAGWWYTYPSEKYLSCIWMHYISRNSCTASCSPNSDRHTWQLSEFHSCCLVKWEKPHSWCSISSGLSVEVVHVWSFLHVYGLFPACFSLPTTRLLEFFAKQTTAAKLTVDQRGQADSRPAWRRISSWSHAWRVRHCTLGIYQPWAGDVFLWDFHGYISQLIWSFFLGPTTPNSPNSGDLMSQLMKCIEVHHPVVPNISKNAHLLHGAGPSLYRTPANIARSLGRAFCFFRTLAASGATNSGASVLSLSWSHPFPHIGPWSPDKDCSIVRKNPGQDVLMNLEKLGSLVSVHRELPLIHSN